MLVPLCFIRVFHLKTFRGLRGYLQPLQASIGEKVVSQGDSSGDYIL
jgi:hypothetical protein